MNEKIRFIKMLSKQLNNADELVAYCTENNMWVEHNPYGFGKRMLLYFFIDYNDEGNTRIHCLDDIDSVQYNSEDGWHDKYRGAFELVLPFDQWTKPEVLENTRECGDYELLNNHKKGLIGKRIAIYGVYDNFIGISYDVGDENAVSTFPHYCVKKIENPPKKMTLEEIEKELGYKVQIIK